MLVAAAGIVASIIGTFFVKTNEGATPVKALSFGTLVSMVLAIVTFIPFARICLPVPRLFPEQESSSLPWLEWLPATLLVS